MSDSAIRVLITGAAGQIGYVLSTLVAAGHMFGLEQKVHLNLLDLPFCEAQLQGVVMELQDLASPRVVSINPTTDPAVGFKDVQYALMCGAFPRKDGMERKDLLEKNAGIFKVMGENLQLYADRNCKVVVVGNPANTNCLICKHFAPSLPDENFTALTRLDHNRAISQLATAVKTEAANVENVIIWGNHSSTQYPDARFATFEGKKVLDNVGDSFDRAEFITTVQKRGAAIIAARKLSSAASAAYAICDHVRNWHNGTPGDAFVSMGVVSDGSYGVAPGIVYSYPVRCKNGRWEIVQNLDIDDFSKEMMVATEKELIEERDTALSFF